MVITAGGHRTVPLLYRIPPHRPVFRHGLFASKTSFPLREHISRPLQVRTRFRKIHRSGRKNNVRCPLGTVQKYRIRLSLATAPITLVPFIGHCMADARDMSLTTAVHKAPQGFTPAICGPSDLLGRPPHRAISPFKGDPWRSSVQRNGSPHNPERPLRKSSRSSNTTRILSHVDIRAYHCRAVQNHLYEKPIACTGTLFERVQGY